MAEFARFGEKAAERRKELTKGELELYLLLLLHSYLRKVGEKRLRVCSITIKRLCEIWGLDYANTVRRYARMQTGKVSTGVEKQRAKQIKNRKYPDKRPPKKLEPMKTPWLTELKIEGEKLIVLLVGVEETFEADFKVRKTVINTPSDCNNYSNSEQKTVINTVSDCNNYSENEKSTVIITVPFKKDSTESLKETLSEGKGESESKNSNNFLSEFSEAEITKYVDLQISRGELKIHTNKIGYVRSLRKSGDSDAHIKAALYPEQIENLDRETYGEPREFSYEPCQVCFGAKMADIEGKGYGKCTHCLDEKGKATGFEPFDSFNAQRLNNALEMLMERIQAEAEIESLKQCYTKEDWEWLMKQLEQTSGAMI